VHEIGCGLGLPGIVASRLGARLTFSDYETPALLLAELNFLEHGEGSAEFLALDFRSPPPRRWPVVLASDVIYECRFLDPFAVFLDAITEPEGCILLAEPGREVARPLFDRLAELGFVSNTTHARPYLHSRHVDVGIHLLTRSASS
jgi:predicted nicotinamide N-methyase